MQEYNTELHNQELVLDIDVNDYKVFMKYTESLANYIWKELKLFTIENIEDATIKAIAIEVKNKRLNKRDNKQSIRSHDWKGKWKQSKEGQAQKNYCENCYISGHVKDKCWILYPELKLKN